MQRGVLERRDTLCLAPRIDDGIHIQVHGPQDFQHLCSNRRHPPKLVHTSPPRRVRKQEMRPWLDVPVRQPREHVRYYCRWTHGHRLLNGVENARRQARLALQYSLEYVDGVRGFLRRVLRAIDELHHIAAGSHPFGAEQRHPGAEGLLTRRPGVQPMGP
ncbi:hypothetical protein NUW58_g9823 [Xylaria curta]|uniref:Uncharacterized protein n=1 Tax=Xylaria curta TaxID=42375 RepID=A0ACC1MSR2_9PEZI|nr:hypothetical protein NUW58_g9823 [Xylaria curta]